MKTNFNHAEYGAKEMDLEKSIRAWLGLALQDAAEEIDFEAICLDCLKNPERLIQIAEDCYQARNGFGLIFGNINVTAKAIALSEFAQEKQQGEFISLVWNSSWTEGRWVHWELDLNTNTAIVEWQTATGKPSTFLNPILKE